jgi:hypothetical protein
MVAPANRALIPVKSQQSQRAIHNGEEMAQL